MASHGGQQTPTGTAEVFPEDIFEERAPEQPSLPAHPPRGIFASTFAPLFADTLRGRVGMSGGDVLKATPALCG